MFSKLNFLSCLFIINASEIYSLEKSHISKSEEFLLQEAITNLQDKNFLLRNGVTNLDECDLESNITEIMRLLDAQSQVRISLNIYMSTEP